MCIRDSVSSAQISQLQALASTIPVDDQVFDYAVRMIRATRSTSALARGAGPRASIALIRCARAHALVTGSEYVTPDHIKEMVFPVLRHRVTLSAEMEIEGSHVDGVLAQTLNTVEAPRL